MLGEAVMRELKRDAQFDNCQPCLDQDDDVTSAQIRCRIHSHAAHQRRFTMSLKTDIQTAYEEQEDVETAARELKRVSAGLTVLQGLCQRVSTGGPLTEMPLLSR